MHKKLSINSLILIIASSFFGCSAPVKEQNKNNEPAGSVSWGHVGNEKYFKIDTKESLLTWKGSMVIGPNSHEGYIFISKGEVLIENGQLMSGTIIVDMNTIEDKTHGRDNKLVNHLKDPDFFDVKKFPTSTIEITRVTSLKDGNKAVTGKLTIKGITHVVTFPIKVEVKNGIFKANGKLVIDRTKWDVRYKSGKFYDLLANQTMSDSIEFDIKILAKNK